MVSITYGHGCLYDFELGCLFRGSSTYTTSAAGAGGGTTTIDASLTQANDYWNGCYIKYLTATNSDNVGEIREITDFDAATDTLTHDAFTAQTSNGDTFLLSAWMIVEDGQTLSTPSEQDGDYLRVTASASAGNESGYVTNFTNISKSTTTYPTIRFRYKTSDTAVKAKLVAEFSDASTQTILADASSTTFTVGSATLTPAKTLDHLRLHTDHATGTVDWDYVLVYVGDFTFPNAGYSMVASPPTRHLYHQVPLRQTDIAQYLGSGNFEYMIGCDMTIGDWTRSTDAVNGEVFYDIVHNASTEPWQWFDSEREQMKVVIDAVSNTRSATSHGLIDRLDLTLREFRLSDGSTSKETYATRWGMDL